MSRKVSSFLCAAALLLLSAPCHSAKAQPELIMPDGQIASQPVRVFVSAEISVQQEPKLLLEGKEDAGKKPAERTDFFRPYEVLEGQQWTVSVDQRPQSLSGSLLLFDLSSYEALRFKAMKRVTPILYWKASGSSTEWREKLKGEEVNIGNGPMVIFYTVVAVAVVVGFIFWISKAARGQAVYLFTGGDGHLSLSRTQMALWTVAIGAVVFGYGLFQRKLPVIPDSLIALMGLSLATTGISYVQVAKKAPKTSSTGASASKSDPAPVRPRLGDLVTVSNTSTPAIDLSIAKAQMLFWTGLILVLFLAKSILEGALWEVPWEMVALMGMSQAGYLGPKFVPAPPADSKPPDGA